MLQRKVMFALVVAANAMGCAVQSSAPSSSGETPTISVKGIDFNAFAGFASCDVQADHADCVVANGYAIDSGYDVTVVADDGSSTTFVAPATITGAPTQDGTPVRLDGNGWDGVWSWKTTSDGSTKALETKLIVTNAYCTFTKCVKTTTGVTKDPNCCAN